MKLKNISLIILSSVFLISCAGIDTVSQYNNSPVKKVDVNGKCFQVFLKTSTNSAYVDECPAASFAKSYFEGMTLGIVDTSPSEESHVKAFETFLEQEKMDCKIDKYPFKIKDGMGGSYGYELKYSCKETF